MKAGTNLPWKKIYDLVLDCGNIHEPRSFIIHVLLGLKEICPFDQGIILFVDGNGKIANQYLLDIDVSWGNAYRDYYSKEDEHLYELKEIREKAGKAFVRVNDWSDYTYGDFAQNYIHARKLKYSMGIVLFDCNGLPKIIYALDRLQGNVFSPSEVMAVKAATLQLNNLYKNFFCDLSESQSIGQIDWDNAGLTPREIEIAKLLCNGISPANISKSLYISQSTTYKHIAHIYNKTGVSSRQQLLVKLLVK